MCDQEEKKQNDSIQLSVKNDGHFQQLDKWLKADFPDAVGEARREIKAQAIRKLELLDEIYMDLVQKAKGVIQRTEEDLRLHDIRMYSKKIRGRLYYLYKRGDREEEFFSILDPLEYRNADYTAQFIGEYRLNEDGTWTHIVWQQI